MSSFMSYNIHHGALEAVVHGMMKALLKTEDYHNLTQCDSLEDMKMNLSNRDKDNNPYDTFLQNETILTPKIITECALKTLVADFYWLRDNAATPLSEFLDYFTYEYQIANVVKLLIGVHAGKGSLDQLRKCHPLGMFRGMEGILAAQRIEDVYEEVLCDTPIGRFFQYEDEDSRTKAVSKSDFDENSAEYIRCILQKNYLESFYRFCESIGGETWEIMKTILDFESDRFVVTLTRNTYGRKDMQRDERQRLFPDLGELAFIHTEIAACEDDDQLREKLRPYPVFFDMLTSATDSGATLEAKMNECAVRLHKDALTRQFQLASFYSIFKLRELEVNNLMWITECLTQGMRSRMEEYTKIY